MAQRKDPPRRQRAAREDCTIGSLKANIETAFKLPSGSVQINNPDGTCPRSDQCVGTLREKWKEESDE
jgi:hypothetical protein